MIKIYRLPIGTRIRYCGFQSNNWELRLIVCDTAADHVSDTLKGIIADNQSPFTSTRFNDCRHAELYGSFTEPFVANVAGTLLRDCRLGFSFLYRPRYQRYKEDIRAVAIGHRILTVSTRGNNYDVSLFYLYEDTKNQRIGWWSRNRWNVLPSGIDQAEKELQQLYESEVANGYWKTTRLWTYPTAEGYVTSTARNTFLFAKEELKVITRQAFEQYFADSLLAERTLNLFQSAVNSNQDIATLSVCVQIGLDGLICQALSGLCKLSAEKWRQLGKLGKADLVRDMMSTWSQFDLSIKYGVLAPFRDYIELAQTLDRYYQGLSSSNSTGLTPFFSKASVAREHHVIGAWDVSLVAGVQWDYLKGSSIEDFFGILHTAGLDLSFTQIWDLVPLSFVVDWGLNVSKILEQFDARFNAMRYPVDYCWTTYLSSTKIIFQDQVLEVKIYDRKTLPGIPSLDHYDLSWENIHGTLSSSNVKEAVAMFFTLFA